MRRFGIHLYENHYNISLPITNALKAEFWMFGVPLRFFDSHHDNTIENLPLIGRYDLIQASEGHEIWQGQFEYPVAVLTAYLVKVLRIDSDGNSSPYARKDRSSARPFPASKVFCLREPAAKFLGLGAIFEYFSSNIDRGITTSPLIWQSPSQDIDSGIFGILLTFAVTSSPLVPLPLVAALTSLPLLYSRDSADPSSLG